MVTKLQPTSRSFVVLAVKVARVGMLVPLSGGYASVGEDSRRGIEMALAEGGEAQVVPVYGDSGADPIQSIREFRNLLL